jgi:hypothetical protein
VFVGGVTGIAYGETIARHNKEEISRTVYKLWIYLNNY